jgi:hypothetical protein
MKRGIEVEGTMERLAKEPYLGKSASKNSTDSDCFCYHLKLD